MQFLILKLIEHLQLISSQSSNKNYLDFKMDFLLHQAKTDSDYASLSHLPLQPSELRPKGLSHLLKIMLDSASLSQKEVVTRHLDSAPPAKLRWKFNKNYISTTAATT